METPLGALLGFVFGASSFWVVDSLHSHRSPPCTDCFWRLPSIVGIVGAKLGGKGRASPVAQMVKNLPVMWETWAQFLGQEDPLEKVMMQLEHDFYSGTLQTSFLTIVSDILLNALRNICLALEVHKLLLVFIFHDFNVRKF